MTTHINQISDQQLEDLFASAFDHRPALDDTEFTQSVVSALPHNKQKKSGYLVELLGVFVAFIILYSSVNWGQLITDFSTTLVNWGAALFGTSATASFSFSPIDMMLSVGGLLLVAACLAWMSSERRF